MDHLNEATERKGRLTPRRKAAELKQRSTAGRMREWLQDRVALAQKRRAVAGMRHAKPSGNGVTRDMVAISKEAAAREPQYVVQHTAPSRAMRRSGQARGVQLRNTPYVAPTTTQMVARRLMDRVRARRSS